jgi:hypothetical protein
MMTTERRTRRRRSAAAAAGLTTVGLLVAPEALAKPVAPSILCATVEGAADCAGHLVACSLCHLSTAPPAWNAYGQQLIEHLGAGAFEDELPNALRQTLSLDADGDGALNADELQVGTDPGDPNDVWGYCVQPAPEAAALPPADYDFVAAFRRVYATICGRSATYEEVARVRELADRAARYDAVHAAATSCLDSAHWRDEALARLADAKIRPISVLGPEHPYGVSLGDYDWDYRLYAYAMTGDRDVRDLLVATYHVRRAPDGTLERVEGAIAAAPSPVFIMGAQGGQPLAPERRAGLLTTQWFITSNTLFSALPRITAAQAYRAFLGNDIAHTQGLQPTPSEPLDVDDKGVGAAACAVCHSTLDPISYVFSYYNGIGSGPPGEFDESRPAKLMPKWSNNESWLLGKQVRSLIEWAAVAAESDEFKRATALDLFRQLYGRPPGPGERPPFEAAWKSLPADGWSANRLVHRLIDMKAFGEGSAP